MMTISELAKEVDDFYYDLDPYGYYDDVKSREEGFLRAKSLISDPVSASKCLQDIIEATTEGLLPTACIYADLRYALSETMKTEYPLRYEKGRNRTC